MIIGPSIRLYLSLDVKKAYVATDVSPGGNKAGNFMVDPLIDGLGLGWRVYVQLKEKSPEPNP